MIAFPLWVTACAAFISCYFTAANYALLNYSRSRLAEVLERRGRSDLMIGFDAARDELLLMTALVRATMNIVILVAILVLFVPPNQVHSWPEMVLALVVAAVLIAVFSVAIPLSWARHAAEPLLAHSLSGLILLSKALYPVMAVLHLFDPIVRRLLGVPKAIENDTAPLQQEILDAVSEGEKSGLVDEDQKEMIQAVVSFPSTTVDQVMTPRTDIQGLSADATLQDAKDFIARTGHSRVPVYEGDLDHIIGVLYAKDLIPLLGAAPPGGEFDLRKIVRDAIFVPETKTLRDLLTQFRELKVHIGIVLDEYGGTAGLVTIEDIIEEIVGEIRDEYETADQKEPGVERIDDRTFHVHGRVYIDDLNDELGLKLPDDEDYDTLGGFVFATLGRVPAKGDAFDYEKLRFTITDAEKTRVNGVKIEVLDRAEAQPVQSTDR